MLEEHEAGLKAIPPLSLSLFLSLCFSLSVSLSGAADAEKPGFGTLEIKKC